MGILFVFNSVLLGVGLAADAFSVSVADAIAEPGMKKGRMTLIAGVFALFQFLMPMAGWACVKWIAGVLTWVQPYFPWIALILLCFIGGKMLIEGIRGGDGGKTDDGDNGTRTEGKEDDAERTGDGEKTAIKMLTGAALLVQGIATSIDALSVGFTIEQYGFGQAAVSALIIGGVTFLICIMGLLLGRKVGERLAGRAGILGGMILIGIGIEILVRGVLL